MRPAAAYRFPLPLAALLALSALVLLVACSETTLDESLTTLKIGDCITNPGQGGVESVDVVDCDEPDTLQVVSKFNVIGYGDEFPGTGTMRNEALETCPDRTITFLAPDKETWEETGDREIVCFDLHD